MLTAACAGQGTRDHAPVSPNAEKAVLEKLDAYHAGNWAAWIGHYSDDARVYYNTVSRPMTATQAAAVHERSVAPLSGYRFQRADTTIVAATSDNGERWIYFTGVWRATFRATGESIAVPTAIRYRMAGDRIVEEHGYWDNGLISGAYQRAADAR